jgi:hypothetical protein
LNKCKENDRNRWYRKYLRVSSDFFNENFEQANREARDVISEMTNTDTKDINLLVDFHLLGIDPSIKNGNPDENLLEQGDRILTNDPSVFVKKIDDENLLFRSLKKL